MRILCHQQMYLRGEIICSPSQRHAAANSRGADFYWCFLLRAGVVNTSTWYSCIQGATGRTNLQRRALSSVTCNVEKPLCSAQQTGSIAMCMVLIGGLDTEPWAGCQREGAPNHRSAVEHLLAQVQGAAEVYQFQVAARVQQQVFRFQVPVHNLPTRRRKLRGFRGADDGQHCQACIMARNVESRYWHFEALL